MPSPTIALLRDPHPAARLGAMCLLLAAGLPYVPLAHADDASSYAIGAGINRMPGWSGAKTMRNSPVPYFDVEIAHVLSLSSSDGLQVDLLRGEVLHGGLYGDYEWGRDREDMGRIAGKLPALSPRFTGGGYLEWQVSKNVDVGTNLSHDLNGASTYWKLYAEWDLPPIGYLQHSLEWRWQALNGAGMRRLYGITPAQAARLGTAPWQPGSGAREIALEYDLFMPTSRHTGIAAALGYARLLGDAADSPLVRQYGTPWQPSVTVAFVYHF